MMYSMTAFARGEQKTNVGNLVCEIRSINHRYLEISLHLSDILRVFETPIRECIRQFIKRGKIECAIRFQPGQSNQDSILSINTALATSLSAAAETIAEFLKQAAPVQPMDILRFPGVLETKETDVNTLEKDVLTLVEHTIKNLLAARHREGEELKQLFFERLQLMQGQINKVREKFPSVISEQQERLRKRFQDAKLELDATRLEQELLMFAQKIDIAEEVERAETHIAEIRRILNEGGAIGRRLDFLLQELNREANTLGSKSIDSIITHAAVEIKVLIEQVREQAQNVE